MEWTELQPSAHWTPHHQPVSAPTEIYTGALLPAVPLQCYNISLSDSLTQDEASKLLWLLAETYEPERLTAESTVSGTEATIVEVGPRLSFSTAWSANAVSICESCDLTKVKRVEQSRRHAPFVVVATPMHERRQHEPPCRLISCELLLGSGSSDGNQSA
jgi:hypothetical protein